MPTFYDTLQEPNGDPIEGALVVVELLTSTAGSVAAGVIPASEATVAWRSTTTTDAAGYWAVEYAAGNDAIEPAGSVYRVNVLRGWGGGAGPIATHILDLPTAAGSYWAGDYLSSALESDLATHALGSHSDVDTSAKADEYVLTYDADTGKWVAAAAAGGGGGSDGSDHNVADHPDAADYATDAELAAHEADTTAVHGLTDGSALQAKVDAIEAGATADQTGAEIKAAYEAELDTNAYDDAAVSKLAGIEAGATADQTGAEIKAAYEAEANTNAYDDAAVSKLAGIEAGATAEATATPTAEGIVELATQAEVDAGADTGRVVTPATLASYSGLPTGTNTGDEVAATTSTAGVVEIATQAEVDTGTDTSRVITPALLASRTVGFELTNTTGQYPPEFPTAEAPVVFTAEVIDEASFFDSGTSTSEITIPRNGWYLLRLDYEYTGSLPENVEDLLLNLMLDDGGGGGFVDVRKFRNWGGLSNDWALIAGFTSLIYLEAGDVIRWTCQQADTPGAARYEWIATGVLLG